jgi:hypothetical protein
LRGLNPHLSPYISNVCWVSWLRSDGSDRSGCRVLSPCSLDVDKPMAQMFSWSLRFYESDLLATHEYRGKRVKAIYVLIHSYDLMVVKDRRFPDGISSIDQYLSLHCYFGILKRTIPLHTGLLRLAHPSPFPRFLVSLSKEGNLRAEVYFGPFLDIDKGNNFPRWSGYRT